MPYDFSLTFANGTSVAINEFVRNNTIPGEQKGITDSAPFVLSLITDDDFATRNTLVNTGFVGMDLVVRDDEGDIKYVGSTLLMRQRTTDNGIQLDMEFTTVFYDEGMERDNRAVDAFQREINSSDDFLKYAVRTRNANWAGKVV